MTPLEQTKAMLQMYGNRAIDVATTPHEAKLLLAFAARRAAVATKRLATGGA